MDVGYKGAFGGEVVSRDAPNVFEFDFRIESLEIKDRGKEKMIFGMGRGRFFFCGNRSGRKLVVGEWR